MSKKSYKQLQNRLYREIKRRIEVENLRVQFNVLQFDRYSGNVEKLVVRRGATDFERRALGDYNADAFIRESLVHALGQKLADEGLMTFSYKEEGHGFAVVEAKVLAVRMRE